MTSRSLRRALLLLVALSCAGRPAGLPGSRDAASGRLPTDVRPVHYELALEIAPESERFAGSVTIEIELARSQKTLWIHGQDLEVSEVRVEAAGESLAGRWEQRLPGIAAVSLPRKVGPGRVRLQLRYTAPFNEHLRGLYRLLQHGDAYAFTQFEPIAARLAVPGFDEPVFKAPFDVTLTVPAGLVAIANTPEISEETLPGGLRRIRFATTPPLASYLLAWAVGPFDVVRGPPLKSTVGQPRPIPFRGIAARGRGEELSYALEHTGPLLAFLESYFARPYPYAKLDIVAVPDFSAGAMENVGAITFRDSLLLMEPGQAPEHQRRGFTYVMAHELAHQWFGNLVTMPWWDDLWLNEAFATWMGYRTVETTKPEQYATLQLLTSVHWAMGADSLISARRIRQPIGTDHDIRNAFDDITYSKGAGVLAMFERWIGKEDFRSGLRLYIERHAEQNAEAADLLKALSESSGRDVTTPFLTFLDQPGVPFLETEVRCEESGALLRMRQSRYLPVGSSGLRERQWQLPVCARYSVGGDVREACTLLTEREGRLPLAACPSWLMPNAGAAGYYRWAQARGDAEKLESSGLAALTPAERLAVADSLEASFRSATRPAADVYPTLARLAGDPQRAVATAPMHLLRFTRDELVSIDSGVVEAYASELYAPRLARLGWEADRDEDGETRLLRGALVGFLADAARDPGVRAEAARRGRRYLGVEGVPDPDALEPELVEAALAVTVEDGDDAVFDTALARLEASDSGLERWRLLGALGHADGPRARRALDLALDPRLRVNEVTAPLHSQLSRPETRDAAWRWLEANFDALVERMGERGSGDLPWLAAGFCDDEAAARIEDFLEPRVGRLTGGPRNLAGAVEAVRLCAALVEAQRAGADAFFNELSQGPTGGRRP